MDRVKIQAGLQVKHMYIKALSPILVFQLCHKILPMIQRNVFFTKSHML